MNNQDRELYKKLMLLAIPMMIQNGITNAVGLVDNVMVGSLGTEAITAVSITVQLIFVFNIAVFGGLSGPGIYGAQYFGKGDIEGVRKVFRMKLWICAFCIITGVIVFTTKGSSLIGLYLKGTASGIDAELTRELGLQYLGIMLFGLIPFATTQVYAGSLRETGESMKPMIAGVCSVVTDIVGNYLLIFGHFGFPCMGVRGAALATVISRFIEMTVLIIWSHKDAEKHVFLRGIFSTMKVELSLAADMIKRGIPIFANEFMWSAGMAALTQCYSIRGIAVVAGMNISNALCNLLNVVFIAGGNAVGIIIGQTLGASKFEKAQKDCFKLMNFEGITCIGLAAILIAISGIFPNVYDTSAEVRNYGRLFIIITALFFPVQGYLNALYFTLRSGGRTFITFLFDGTYTWVVAVSLAYVLCYHTSISIFAAYAIVQAADMIKIVIGYVLVKKGIWLSNLT